MNKFKERETAFESKFAHDIDMQFKADARTNKLLGMWAAEKLGLKDDEAAEYAKTVVISDLEEPGHEDVVRKVAADLGEKSDPDKIRKKLKKMRAKARSQLLDEL